MTDTQQSLTSARRRGRLTRRELLAGAAGAIGAAVAPVSGQQAVETTRRPGRGPLGPVGFFAMALKRTETAIGF